MREPRLLGSAGRSRDPMSGRDAATLPGALGERASDQTTRKLYEFSQMTLSESTGMCDLSSRTGYSIRLDRQDPNNIHDYPAA